MIILRKVRGISGLTPMIRNQHGRLAAAAGPSLPSLASVGSLLTVCAVLVAIAMALVWAVTASHAPHLAFGGHAMAALPVMGSLGALRETEGKLQAKQKELAGIFEAAGAELDFAKPEVLKASGANDSAGVVAKVRELNTELETLGKSRDELVEMKRIAEENDRRMKQAVNRPAFPGDPSDRREAKRRSFGEVIVGSEIFQSNLKAKLQGQSLVEGFGLKELKTLFQTGAGWAPESLRTPGLVIDKATRPIQILDIIPTGSTGQAAVKYMEETTRVHNAAERAESAAYAEDQFVLTERSETVRSIGSSIPVTDEQLEDVAGVQSYLDQRLQFGVRQRLDGQVVNGDGNAPNLTGILNKAGIQTQAKGADPAPDAFYKAMTLIRVTGRALPSAHIIHPTDWQGIRLLRTADGLYIWGSPAEAGPDRLWGLQAVQSDALAQGTGIVGDFVNFIQLYERSGMEVAVGYVNDDFTKGKRTIRAGLRVALTIYRAAAFCTVTGL